jgi:Domain of unknown function (DUF4278)
MKLTFLGVSYTPSMSDVETVVTETEFSFLGKRCKMKTTRALARPSFDEQLTYRGIHYRG